MAFSFSRLMISESDDIICQKAFNAIGSCCSNWQQVGTASCVGIIDKYKVWLGFKKGVPSWECSCGINNKACVHVVILSLIWDRQRGVPDPSQSDINYLTTNSK